MRAKAIVLWAMLAIGAVASMGDGASIVAAAPAEEMPPLRYHHPWGRCGEGSWQTVRMTTESLDERGQVTAISITDTRTTLDQVTPDGVTLKVEVTVEVGGRRMATQPQIVKQSFSGATNGENVTIKKLDPTTLDIDGKSLTCDSQELSIMSKAQKRTSLISYTDKSPHILKRTVLATESTNPAGNFEATSEVIELDMPYKVLSELKSAAVVRSVQKSPSGTTATLSVNVSDVPGDIVAHSSKKLDADGRVVRRSTLELTGYRWMSLDPGTSTDNNTNYVPRRQREKRRAALSRRESPASAG